MNIVIVGIGNLGFEIAQRVYSSENNILLISRNLPDYAKDFINNKNVFHLKADATSIDDLHFITKSNVFDKFQSIHKLVITPGFDSKETFIEDFEKFRQCFEFNYFVYINALKIFLSYLQVYSQIILISATSAHHADKRLNGYPTSKWAQENVFSSLREELRTKLISVEVIAVRTIKNKYSKIWTQKHGEDPERIAKIILKIIQKPKNKRYFIPKHYLLFRVFERALPCVFDYVHGLKNNFYRRRIFARIKSEKILITGAAQGLGKALAYTYAETAKTMYLCDIDVGALTILETEIKKKYNCDIEIFNVDVSDRIQLQKMVDSIDYIDLLINNVGVRFQGSVEESSLNDYNKNLSINLYSHLFLISEFFKKNQSPQKIINVLSTTAICGRSLHALYSSAKAAMWYCTRSLRRIYGNKIQIVEVIPSSMSNTLLVEKTVVANVTSAENIKDVIHISKSLQNKTPLLNVKNISAQKAAYIIKSAEEKGKEIVFIPKVKAKLFMLLELFSNKLFFKIFKR